jgi:hypothetical protein
MTNCNLTNHPDIGLRIAYMSRRLRRAPIIGSYLFASVGFGDGWSADGYQLNSERFAQIQFY